MVDWQGVLSASSVQLIDERAQAERKRGAWGATAAYQRSVDILTGVESLPVAFQSMEFSTAGESEGESGEMMELSVERRAVAVLKS
jgi:hypothetical protein